MRTLINEDTHFYIDNAPPEEVALTMHCLSASEAMSPQMIAERLYADYGFRMQKDRTYSPRRLYDLGLANQSTAGGKLSYTLTNLGTRMLNVMALDHELYADLMHFLHYSRYNGEQDTRKYLWSYRRCCEIVWSEGQLVPTQELAARIQGMMKEEFPHLDFSAREGARFDSTAAGRFYTWIKNLSPSPFPNDQHTDLQRRLVQHYELVLLALDYVYHARGYRYGDPVVLDTGLLDEVARVFFLDHQCCRELITLATKMTRIVALADTFAGTSIKLLAPYNVESI